MKDYVIVGTAYWSNIHTPESEYFNPTYRLTLCIPTDKSAKLASEGVRINSFGYKPYGLYSVTFQKKAAYGDQDFPGPPVYNKEGKRIDLDDELPNGLKVKVKFRISKGVGFDNTIAELVAIMLLEDIANEFDDVENY